MASSYSAHIICTSQLFDFQNDKLQSEQLCNRPKSVPLKPVRELRENPINEQFCLSAAQRSEFNCERIFPWRSNELLQEWLRGVHFFGSVSLCKQRNEHKKTLSLNKVNPSEQGIL